MVNKGRHRLLARQMKKLVQPEWLEMPGFESFLDSVNEAYQQHDTEYKQLEHIFELSSKESFKELSNFRLALDEAAAVFIIDTKQILQYVNEKFCEVTGYAREEVLQKHYSKFFPIDNFTHEYFKDIAAEVSKGKVWKGEIQGHHRSGAKYWSDTTIVPFVNTEGRPTQYLFISIDISARIQIEEKQAEVLMELKKSNQELNDFAYIISHDLKAPLRAIGSLTNWLSQDYREKLDDQGRQLIDLLNQRTIRMHNLIEGVLNYSRISHIHHNVVQQDANEIVNEVVADLNLATNIQVKIGSILPAVWFEETKLRQVFQNLIGNAAKYMNKEQGLIEVLCKEDGNFWWFEIKDNGPGIDESHYQRIFKIFQTLQPKDTFESTGIGLSIVKKIVEMGGGSIHLTSKMGEGTSFFFSIPKNH
jgi:PAS domain S-box-containing protein